MRQQNKFFFALISISRVLGTDYRTTDNQPVPYRCISIYITLWQIYSGNCISNFIRIVQV